MRTVIGKYVLALAVGIMLLPALAAAQVTDRITVTTKFPFTVGETKLPAGSYVIQPLDDESEVFELSSTDGKMSVLFETMGAELANIASKSEVVFKKYGDNYVLSQINQAGSKESVVSVASRSERRHAKSSGKPSKEAVATAKAP